MKASLTATWDSAVSSLRVDREPPPAPAAVTLPTATSLSSRGATAGGVLPAARRCVPRRRVKIRIKRGHGKTRVRSAKVFVEGKRVKVRRRAGRLRAIVDLRGRHTQRVKVRIVAKTRSGKTLRETRTYRTCTKKTR